MNTVIKISCIHGKAIFCEMIAFGNTVICGTDVHGKHFTKKVEDVVSVKMVDKNEIK